MATLLRWLLGGLVNIAATVAGRMLLGLGIGVITYTGLSFTLGWLKAMAVAQIGMVGAQWMGILATLQVGACISMVFSAMAVRMIVQGMSGDSFKRFVKK